MKLFKQYLKEEIDNQFLTEGLISSYDVKKLHKEIEKNFGSKISSISTVYDGETIHPHFIQTKFGQVFTISVHLTEPLTTKEKTILNKILNVYGYFNSLNSMDQLQLQLEPKYPVQMNSLLESNSDQDLYHITQRRYLNRIAKIGLIPRISQTTFEHTGTRIYLMWMPQQDEDYKKHVLTKFTGILARNKKVSTMDMIVLKIAFNPQYSYYIDDTTTMLNRGIIGLFTTSNIKPSEITFNQN